MYRIPLKVSSILARTPKKNSTLYMKKNQSSTMINNKNQSWAPNNDQSYISSRASLPLDSRDSRFWCEYKYGGISTFWQSQCQFRWTRVSFVIFCYRIFVAHIVFKTTCLWQLRYVQIYPSTLQQVRSRNRCLAVLHVRNALYGMKFPQVSLFLTPTSLLINFIS